MKSDQYKLHGQMETRHWWFLARRHIMGELVRHILPAGAGKKIIDIGCGTGGNAAYLSRDYSLSGIDSSQDAVGLAQKKWPNVEFYHIPFFNDQNEFLRSMIKKADLLLLMDVLEHIRQDEEMLTTLIQTAAKGTYFLITVPANMKLWSEHDVSFGHFRRYNLPGFQKIWQGQPVRPLLISHFNSRLYPIVRAIRFFNQITKSTRGDCATDLKISNPITNKILKRIFIGEKTVLLDLLSGKRRQGYARGVSLIAILQRT